MWRKAFFGFKAKKRLNPEQLDSNPKSLAFLQQGFLLW